MAEIWWAQRSWPKPRLRGHSPRSLLVRLADIARRSDDPKAAARAYERLEAALGDNEGDQMLRGSLLIARAELLLRADEWDAAAPLMERAVALRPNDAAVLNFAGYSAASNGARM